MKDGGKMINVKHDAIIPVLSALTSQAALIMS